MLRQKRKGKIPMAVADLRLIKRFAEFRPREEIDEVPRYTRGIYVLLKYRPRLQMYDVVYVGMAGGPKAGIRGRLKRHASRKGHLWTHFSIFEVWENITENEVKELEGLFRQIYRKDPRANKLNRQRQFKKLRPVRMNKLAAW